MALSLLFQVTQSFPRPISDILYGSCKVISGKKLVLVAQTRAAIPDHKKETTFNNLIKACVRTALAGIALFASLVLWQHYSPAIYGALAILSLPAAIMAGGGFLLLQATKVTSLASAIGLFSVGLVALRLYDRLENAILRNGNVDHSRMGIIEYLMHSTLGSKE